MTDVAAPGAGPSPPADPATHRPWRRHPLARVVVALAWCVVVGQLGAVALRQAPVVWPPPLLWAVTLLLWILLPGAAVLAMAVVLRRRALGVAASLVLVAGLAVYVPEWGAGSRPLADGASTVRIVSANLLFTTDDVGPFLAVVDEVDPDVVITMETTQLHRQHLAEAGLAARYPYVVEEPGGYGTVLRSRLPLEAPHVLTIENRFVPAATLITTGGPVDLLAVHLSPPTFGTGPWRNQLVALRDHVAQLGRPLLAGDFNASSDHWSFRELLDAGLEDGQRTGGSGLGLTWPDGRGVAWAPAIRIDHVLVGDGLVVTGLDVRSDGPSDHRLLVADVAVLPAT